jgi:hypothetical protein
MGVHEKLTGAERAARHRAKMRAQGLRLKQFWVPDLRIPEVRNAIMADAEKLARQSHRWEDVYSEMEALQADLLDNEPAPDFREPKDDEPGVATK